LGLAPPLRLLPQVPAPHRLVPHPPQRRQVQPAPHRTGAALADLELALPAAAAALLQVQPHRLAIGRPPVVVAGGAPLPPPAPPPRSPRRAGPPPLPHPREGRLRRPYLPQPPPGLPLLPQALLDLLGIRAQPLFIPAPQRHAGRLVRGGDQRLSLFPAQEPLAP